MIFPMAIVYMLIGEREHESRIDTYSPTHLNDAQELSHLQTITEILYIPIS
jgi:hypothetical protein